MMGLMLMLMLMFLLLMIIALLVIRRDLSSSVKPGSWQCEHRPVRSKKQEDTLSINKTLET